MIKIIIFSRQEIPQFINLLKMLLQIVYFRFAEAVFVCPKLPKHLLSSVPLVKPAELVQQIFQKFT